MFSMKVESSKYQFRTERAEKVSDIEIQMIDSDGMRKQVHNRSREHISFHFKFFVLRRKESL